MGTFLRLLLIVGVVVCINQKNKRPRYGTQAYLDWKYKDMPGDKEYWKAIEKRSMDCTYSDIPLTHSEKAAYNKAEREHGRPGID